MHRVLMLCATHSTLRFFKTSGEGGLMYRIPFLGFLFYSLFAVATPTRLTVKVPNKLLDRSFIQRYDFIPDHKRDPQFAYGYVDESSWVADTSMTSVVTVLGREKTITPEQREGYHDYAALTESLQMLQAKYPNLATLHSAGKSVQGRELWYVVLSDQKPIAEAEPKLLYVANMHGDEVVGRELMLYLIEYLLSNYGHNTEITHLIDHSEIFIMPSMNPDGFELGTRFNANSKDLNRNFPDIFEDPQDVTEGREPEVQHLMKLAHNHHFVSGINWHGGELCINIPWDNRPNNETKDLFPDDPIIFKMASTYTRLNRPMYQNHQGKFIHGVVYGYEWFPIKGGIQDYFNGFVDSLMVTGELSVVKWPLANTLQQFWMDNRDGMVQYLKDSLTGVSLLVMDSQGQPVPQVEISVDSAPARWVKYGGAAVFRPTIEGTQQVKLRAPGYVGVSLELKPSLFDGKYSPVYLK